MIEYLTGWLVWLAATVLVIFGGLRLTRGLRPAFLRDLIRLVAVAILVTPAPSGPEPGYFAPAYIVLVFERFFVPDGNPAAAATALTFGIVVALAVLGVVQLRGRGRDRGRGDAPATEA